MRPPPIRYAKSLASDRQRMRLLRGIKLTRRVRRALQSFLDELVLLQLVIDNFQHIAGRMHTEPEEEEEENDDL
ncbi:hypothetical protein AWZ03_011229 [Drosophila navojoa]|uniref:Uncharacterized protein n=1 Tax=Drosophila navojoa TaxID=7232 RepID=A0A484B3E7_DRONA|nr:hypothetical protein AWZ03_011229 [Drosophila navojoa]